MIEDLPDNVHKLTQRAWCRETAVAAMSHRQLNSTSAQWCWYGQTDGQGVMCKLPINGRVTNKQQ